MKKIPLAVVGIVALFGLFALFNFFKEDPNALVTYYSSYGLEKCTLPIIDSSFPYDLCVQKGVDYCKSMFFEEPQIMAGWDYCYKVCVRYVYDACVANI